MFDCVAAETFPLVPANSVIGPDDEVAPRRLRFSLCAGACAKQFALVTRTISSAAAAMRAVEGGIGVCYSIWFGAWRSLVAHLPWEQGVGRSNRLAPTRASSSGGKSNGLLSRGSGVRIPSGAPPKGSAWDAQQESSHRALCDFWIFARVRLEFDTAVSVAQLVEHWIVAPGVEGSIPFTHPTQTCYEKRFAMRR